MTGGNHMINLLTTSPLIYSESKLENYVDYLKSFYTSKLNKENSNPKLNNVHRHEKKSLLLNVYKDSNNLDQKVCRLVYGHKEEYQSHFLKSKIRNNFFKYLPYTISCIVTAPQNTNGRLYKRLKHFHNTNNYVTQLSLDKYELPFKIVGYNLFDNSNSIILNSDIFGESDGSYYFQEKMLLNFKLSLTNEIHDIHRLWINMIDRSLENK